MAGIYIHIPFCRKACHYCNFHFSTTHHRIPAMIAAIGKEALLRKQYLTEPVETIYWGGGTPSLLDTTEIGQLLQQLGEYYSISSQAEITLETNPDDITPRKLAAWRKAGINRLSIGIQSFEEQDLQWMNRAHTAAQSLLSIQQAKEAGFTNITIDLIYGTPGLTDEQWKKNIDTALALSIPHLSCYALTVEPKTALAAMIGKQEVADVDPGQQARQFALLTQKTAQAGMEQYEISNFAQPGFRSRHNSSYWQGKPYLGLGPSAHSFNGYSRQWNIANNSLYLTALEKGEIPFEEEVLTLTQQLNEYIMTGLRTIEGISLGKLTMVWGEEKAAAVYHAAGKYLAQGQVRFVNNALQLEETGKFFADGIAADLFQ
jgi:oxygen-independent coproporphyrinogen-3 oxidase